MKPKTVYLALCLVGTIFPYWQFLPWLLEHGLNLRLLLQELFANRISAFFAADVILSALTLLAFIRVERSRLRMRHYWLPVLAVLTVGVSMGLPMLFYMREVAVEREAAGGNDPA
jgi:uncharacterized protein DUF2834